MIHVFSPLFFAAIGIRVDFFANFHLPMVLVVLTIAFAGKIGGCVTAGRWLGMPASEAWAVGFGMNSRGAMEIILAQLAREHGLIDDRFFVALVVMALVTSLASGPLIQRSLGRARKKPLEQLVREVEFVPRLEGQTKAEVIRELAGAIATAARVPVEAITEAVLARESLMGTALGHGVALPHGHVKGLAGWHLAIGCPAEDVDFDSPDGEPVRLVCLFLTPEEDPAGHVQVLAALARWLHDPDVRNALAGTRSPEEARLAIDRLLREGRSAAAGR